MTYGISDELAGTVGLMCGGIVHIFIHELKRRARATRCCADLQATIEHTPGRAGHADRRRARRAPSSSSTPSGVTGSLGAGELLDKNAAREAQGLLAEGRSSMRDFGTDGASLGCGLRVYASIQAEPPRMVVFGAIDFSSALAPLAKGLGYRVTIADPRSAFLASRRFSRRRRDRGRLAGRGPRRRRARPARRGADLHPRPEARRARRAGRAGDRRRLHRRARQSRNTTADRNRRLRDVGVTDEEIERIFAPCGLDIGASTVEETAVAVLAEIIAHRAGRHGQPLREAEGPIRHADTTNEREEAAWPIPSP